MMCDDSIVVVVVVNPDRRSSKSSEAVRTDDSSRDVVFLARAKLREYVTRTGAEFSKRKTVEPKDFVQFGPDVPDKIRDDIMKIS